MKEDAKKFWKENKKKIIGGVALATVGCIGGVVLIRNMDQLKKDYHLFKMLRQFDNGMLERIDEMQKGATYAATLIPGETIDLANIGEAVKENIEHLSVIDDLTGKTLSGSVVFLK